jgi:DnaJ like chaperone protein
MRRNRGKLFGAALGFSFGGPIGALLGTAIGHLVDVSDDGSSTTGGSRGPYGAAVNQSNENLTFITSLVYLLVGTARSDGEATKGEVDTIRAFFRQQLGYGDAQMFVIDRIIGAAVERDVNLGETCSDIRARTVYEERLFLVRLCFEVALSDHRLNPTEDNFIGQAACSLGIEEYDYMMVRRTFVDRDGGKSQRSAQPLSEERNPYAVLGVQPGSSREDVQQAYRELAAKYHPDKVSHLGEEFIELATRKFTDIQNAYDQIMDSCNPEN